MTNKLIGNICHDSRAGWSVLETTSDRGDYWLCKNKISHWLISNEGWWVTFSWGLIGVLIKVLVGLLVGCLLNSTSNIQNYYICFNDMYNLLCFSMHINDHKYVFNILAIVIMTTSRSAK